MSDMFKELRRKGRGGAGGGDEVIFVVCFCSFQLEKIRSAF